MDCNQSANAYILWQPVHANRDETLVYYDDYQAKTDGDGKRVRNIFMRIILLSDFKSLHV